MYYHVEYSFTIATRQAKTKSDFPIPALSQTHIWRSTIFYLYIAWQSSDETHTCNKKSRKTCGYVACKVSSWKLTLEMCHSHSPFHCFLLFFFVDKQNEQQQRKYKFHSSKMFMNATYVKWISPFRLIEIAPHVSHIVWLTIRTKKERNRNRNFHWNWHFYDLMKMFTWNSCEKSVTVLTT